eukprot:2591710-Amphidinium_carterae.1
MAKIVDKLKADKVLDPSVTLNSSSALAHAIEICRSGRAAIMEQASGGNAKKMLSYTVGLLWSSIKGGDLKNVAKGYKFEQASPQELVNFMSGASKPQGIGAWVAEQNRKGKGAGKAEKGNTISFEDKDAAWFSGSKMPVMSSMMSVPAPASKDEFDSD